jgi:hypothetical protein
MERMCTVVNFEAFGARIAVRATESIGSSLSLRLPPNSRIVGGSAFDVEYTVKNTAKGSAADGTEFAVARNGLDVGVFRTLAAVRHEIESDVHFRVAVAAKEFLFVHAGVVHHGGRAIVVPGRSLSGKSSLVKALVEVGATYSSDEYAVLDELGRVHSYRKPLSERVAGRSTPLLHSPASLSPPGESDPVSIGLIVVTTYRPDATWTPQPITRAEALMALFDNTVMARESPDFALEILAKAVSGAIGIRSDRAEAKGPAEDILDALRPPGE